MEIIKPEIEGLVVIKPKAFGDSRGYFFESFSETRYKEAGIDTHFIQDNISKSVRGVVRGLHYQLAPHAQSKLVQVLQGRIIDVAVDLRKNSPTFGKHYAIELSDENKLQFFIPKGFAHGFSVLSDEVIFHYKCDNYYNKESEAGININDPELNIDWGLKLEEQIISDKDLILPMFKDAVMNF